MWVFGDIRHVVVGQGGGVPCEEANTVWMITQALCRTSHTFHTFHNFHNFHNFPPCPSARSLEEALVHAFVEARRSVPAVLFLPHLEGWWRTAPPALKACLTQVCV